jgi:hypothetical protein
VFVPSAPAPLIEVSMRPRTGYPFPPSLTRLVGLIVFDDTGLIAPGAQVKVYAEHGGASGASASFYAADDGQYTAWFLPEASGFTPPLADGYQVAAFASRGGVDFTGSLSSQPLAPNRRNDAPVIRLTP